MIVRVVAASFIAVLVVLVGASALIYAGIRTGKAHGIAARSHLLMLSGTLQPDDPDEQGETRQAG